MCRSQLFQKNYFSHNQQLTRNFFKTPHALPPHSTQKAMLDSENFESEKRNCGRTGPTSPEGRATSSKNSIKHGSCSQTLILPFESEESWLLLLNRWLQTYQPPEDSLLYDFVLKTAQAEWYRMRAQRNLDCHECSQQGLSPSNWTPEYIKKHDLLLRYRTSAERSFQRTFRLLEQFCKLHPTVPTSPKPADPKPESVFRVIGEDHRQSHRPYPLPRKHQRCRNPRSQAVLPSRSFAALTAGVRPFLHIIDTHGCAGVPPAVYRELRIKPLFFVIFHALCH